MFWNIYTLVFAPDYFSHHYWQLELWPASSFYKIAQDMLKNETCEHIFES